jgi:subtilisin family serine protease
MTKRWILRGLVAPLAIGLSACGPAGGAELSQSESQCRDSDRVVRDHPIRPFAVGSDPFKKYGKVLLSTGSGVASDAGDDQLRAMSIARDHDEFHGVVAGGAELSVTIREQCQAGGEISRLFGSRLAGVTTPAGVRSFTWQLPRDYGLAELQALADQDSCLVGVTDSVSSYVSAISSKSFTDPLTRDQKHFEWLEAIEAFREFENESGLSANDVVIAVIDTGIDPDHPDLKNVLWINQSEIPGNGVDDDGNGYIDDVHGFNFATGSGSPRHVDSWPGHEHGSHVAGLAAAEGGNGVGVSGVMPMKARIMALNVFGDSPGASSSDTANAIRYAADNGAHVINMSLGGYGRSVVYESAIAYAIQKGVTVIAAAGNEGFELNESNFISPASYAGQFHGMVTVASVDATSGAFSDFSNYGPDYVQLAAPGSEDSFQQLGLLSTWSKESYVRLQGTSMASPVVAGAAAFAIYLLRARGYSPTPAAIEDILLASAVTESGLEDRIAEGRMLNLRKLAGFIKKNFPPRMSGGGDARLPDRDAHESGCP